MRFEAIELPDRLSSPAAFLEDEDMSSAEGGEGDDDAADDVEDLEEAA